ncbi:unnamed protein product [Sympodiomycopsis kandeliae]
MGDYDLDRDRYGRPSHSYRSDRFSDYDYSHDHERDYNYNRYARHRQDSGRDDRRLSSARDGPSRFGITSRDSSNGSRPSTSSGGGNTRQPPPPPSSDYQRTPPPPPGLPPVGGANKRQRTTSPDSRTRQRLVASAAASTTSSPSYSSQLNYDTEGRATRGRSGLATVSEQQHKEAGGEEGEVIQQQPRGSSNLPPRPDHSAMSAADSTGINGKAASTTGTGEPPPPPPVAALPAIKLHLRSNGILEDMMAMYHTESHRKIEPQPTKPSTDRFTTALIDAIKDQVSTQHTLHKAKSLLQESLSWIADNPSDRAYYDSHEKATQEASVEEAQRAYTKAQQSVVIAMNRLLDVLLEYSLDSGRSAFKGSITASLKKMFYLAEAQQTEFRDNFKKIQNALSGSTSVGTEEGSRRRSAVTLSPERSRDKDRSRDRWRERSRDRHRSRDRSREQVRDAGSSVAEGQDVGRSRDRALPDTTEGEDVSMTDQPTAARSRSESRSPSPSSSRQRDLEFTITSGTSTSQTPRRPPPGVSSYIVEKFAEVHELLDERMHELRETFQVRLGERVKECVDEVVLRNRRRRLQSQNEGSQAREGQENPTASESGGQEGQASASTSQPQSTPQQGPPSNPPARRDATPRAQAGPHPPPTAVHEVARTRVPTVDLQMTTTGDPTHPSESTAASNEIQTLLNALSQELHTRIDAVRRELETAHKRESDELNSTLQHSFNLVSDQFQKVDKIRVEENNTHNARAQMLEKEGQAVKTALQRAMEERRFLHDEIKEVRTELQKKDAVLKAVMNEMYTLKMVVYGAQANGPGPGPGLGSTSPQHAHHPPQQQPINRQQPRPPPSHSPQQQHQQPPQSNQLNRAFDNRALHFPPRPASTHGVSIRPNAPQQQQQQQQRPNTASPHHQHQGSVTSPTQTQGMWNIQSAPVALPPPRFANQQGIPPGNLVVNANANLPYRTGDPDPNAGADIQQRRPSQQPSQQQQQQQRQTPQSDAERIMQMASALQEQHQRHILQQHLQQQQQQPGQGQITPGTPTALTGSGTQDAPFQLEPVMGAVNNAAQQVGILRDGERFSVEQFQHLIAVQPSVAGRITSQLNDNDLERQIESMINQQRVLQQREMERQQQQQQSHGNAGQQGQGQSNTAASMAEVHSRALSAVESDPESARQTLIQQRNLLHQQQQPQGEEQNTADSQAVVQPSIEPRRIIDQIDSLLSPSASSATLDQNRQAREANDTALQEHEKQSGESASEQPHPPPTTSEGTSTENQEPTTTLLPSSSDTETPSIHSRRTLEAIVSSFALLPPEQRQRLLKEHMSHPTSDDLSRYIRTLEGVFPTAKEGGEEESPTEHFADAQQPNDASDEAEIDELISTPPPSQRQLDVAQEEEGEVLEEGIEETS